MKSVQFAIYWRTDEYGRRRRTTHKMSEETARQLIDPVIDPSSIEVRDIPDEGESLLRPGASYPDCKSTYPGRK